MDLLDVPLPDLRLRIDLDASDFLDRCENIGHRQGWMTDRRREYAGPGYDQLNLHLGGGSKGYPMLRLVAVPKDPRRLRLDVVADWNTWPLTYDEYLDVARHSFGQILGEYKTAHGKRYRLGIPKRPVSVDLDSIDCATIGYAAEKFGGLCRSLAIGGGDARARLISAFWTFHVIRPEDLPEPLRGHLSWVYAQITKRPARHREEGSVEGTVWTMRRTTAARVLERLVDLAEAIQKLDEHCQAAKGSAA